MKRSQPLKRATRLKPKRATKRKSRRVHSPEYMGRVRELPCIVAEMLLPGPLPPREFMVAYSLWLCDGPNHAHHMGERGLGQKCSDLETVCLCERHHREWHDCRGAFARWSKDKRRGFARAAIEQTQAELMPKKEDDK